MGDFLTTSRDELKLAELATVCERGFVALHDTLGDENDPLPRVGSLLAADMEEQGSGATSQVQRIVGLYAIAANWCLGGLATLFQSPMLLFAPAPLARATVEYGVAADWVLAARTSRGRCARAWLVNLDSCEQDANTASRPGALEGTLGDAADRLRRLTGDTLPKLFGAADLKKFKGAWHLAGETLPGRTELVRQFVERHIGASHGAAVYRLMSAMAHPTTSGTFPFVSDEANGSSEITWDYSITYNLANVALNAWYASAGGYLNYVGLPSTALLAWKAFASPVLHSISP